VVPTPTRIALLVAAPLGLVWAWSWLVLDPLQSELANLRTELPRRQALVATLGQLREAQAAVEALGSRGRPGSRPPVEGASLLSSVEAIVQRLKLSDKAIQMRPVAEGSGAEERLEIRFMALGFRNVLDFLDEVEALPANARIDALTIRKAGPAATMQLTISQAGGGGGGA
jgi:type II secretory pathway component PulM